MSGAQAGRITVVRELGSSGWADAFDLVDGVAVPRERRRWSVLVSTYEGIEALTLTSWDPNILPPLENETLQCIPYLGRFRLIFVSGRQFELWRNPEIQYRPSFDEYSRVHVPADPIRRHRT